MFEAVVRGVSFYFLENVANWACSRVYGINQPRVGFAQQGFLKGRKIYSAILSFYALIESSRFLDKILFVIYVDIKKAFPTVRREILFKVLEEQGTPDNVIRTLINIYKDTNSVIRGKSGFGCIFPIENCTREGGVVYLFCSGTPRYHSKSAPF